MQATPMHIFRVSVLDFTKVGRVASEEVVEIVDLDLGHASQEATTGSSEQLHEVVRVS